jgi:transposase
MAGNRIEIMDLKNLIRLKNNGLSNRKIALELSISRNTVNNYTTFLEGQNLDYKDLLELSEKDLDNLFPTTSEVDKSRFEELSQYFEHFGRELKKIGCTKEILWKEYRSKHPDGYMLSQFNHHLNVWLNRINGSTKLEHKAGDKLYIDFCGKKLSYVDKQTGEMIDVEIFVGILPASQYTFVYAVKSQSTEDLIEALNACLQYFKGVPQAIVPDNLKAAVIKSNRFAPKINPTLRDFAQHYGCVINPTRTYSPQDKALVENAVSIVYKRIYYPLNKSTFFTLDTLNSAIINHLELYNDQLFSKRNTTRRQEFLTLEKNHLAALPSSIYECRHFKKLTVQKMGHIYLSDDKHYYSVPYRLIGKLVSLMFNTKTVEIFYQKERVALHKRDYTNGAYSTLKEHLSSSAKVYSEWSLPYFEGRAKKIGFFTGKYITELINQKPYPEIGYKQAQGILMLTKQFAPERLEQACQRASELERRNYHIIENILKNGMDQECAQVEDVLSQITNPNVRGSIYYK